MKFFAFAMMAAACTVAANAQTPYGNLDNQDNAYLKSRQVKETEHVFKLATTPVANPMAKAPAQEGLTAMFDQPEGELMLMRRSGTDYLPMWGSPAPADYSEKGTYVVKGTDGNYYFKNFVTNMCNGGAWVKGEVKGDVVSVATGQICTQLWYFNGYEDKLFTYYLHAVTGTEETVYDEYYGYEYTQWVYDIDPSVTSIDFKIEADGSLSPLNPDVIFGGLECENGAYSWPGYGDKNCTFFPFNETPQAAPEGLEFQDFVVDYKVYSQQNYRMAQGAVQDGVFYLKALADIIPDGIIMAQLDGDQATFVTDQFLGVEEKYSTLAYFKACSQREELDEWGWATIYNDPADLLTFSYDADQLRLSNNDGAMVINAGKTQILSHEVYSYPTFYAFLDKPVTPATPVWTQFMPYTVFDWGAWGYAGFDIYTQDVDGNYILPENLYYICYLDDAVFEIWDEASQTIYDEIPYNFSNNDVVGGGYNSHYIYFYVDGFDRFGVQSVYYGGGERRCSPVVYYGEEPEDPSDPVAISTANREIASTIITDAAGHVRSHLGQGLNIVTVRYTDGTTKTAKMMIK